MRFELFTEDECDPAPEFNIEPEAVASVVESTRPGVTGPLPGARVTLCTGQEFVLRDEDRTVAARVWQAGEELGGNPGGGPRGPPATHLGHSMKAAHTAPTPRRRCGSRR